MARGLNRRQQRIAAAFDNLCADISRALGAAEGQRAKAERALAETMAELLLREQGLAAARADAAMKIPLANPRLADVVERVAADERAAFGEWLATGPRELATIVADGAPGPAGRPPREWLGRFGKAEGADLTPSLWRIGSGRIGGSGEPFDVAVPLLDEGHLQISSVHDRRGEAEALVESLVMRVMSYFRPGLVSVHVWDTGQFTGSLPGLYPLTRTDLLTVHHPGRLPALLEELSDRIRRLHTRLLIDGHPSLAALARDSGKRTEPWVLAVLMGNREPLKDEEYVALQRVARGGPACGVQLVLLDVPLVVNAPVETITLGAKNTVSSMTGPHVQLELDPPISTAGLIDACQKITAEHETWRDRVNAFHDLLPDDDKWGAGSSVSGLRAPIGFSGVLPVELTLADSSPHALIGGPSGAGKTNLLLTLIASLAAKYNPDELEFYLLDFKEGVSFAQFTPGRRDPSWLPHARLVGVNINTDREFGLALLQFLADEMRRRSEVAKEHEVTKLEELRLHLAEEKRLRAEEVRKREAAKPPDLGKHVQAGGRSDEAEEPEGTNPAELRKERDADEMRPAEAAEATEPEERWPRIVAVIDEFQYLFTERDAVTRAATQLLEDVARRGRSQGIHLVLASQDVSGIEAFWGRPAIFEQFVLRIALPRARRVLADLNDATLDLPRWHAVLNHESGIKHGNEIVRIPNATAPGAVEEVQRRLHERYAAKNPPPRLFDGSRAPHLANLLDMLPGAAGPPRAVVGQCIDVAGSPATVALPSAPGRNLGVLGTASADAIRVLGAAATAVFTRTDAEVTIAPLVSDAAEAAKLLAAAAKKAERTVDVVGLDRFTAHIQALAAEVTARLESGDRALRIVVVYGADAADGLLGRDGTEAFRRVLRFGPECGIHVLGWWRSIARLRALLMMSASVDDVGAWVALDVQGSELSALVPGLMTAWSARTGRGLLFDRAEHAVPQVVIVPSLEAP